MADFRPNVHFIRRKTVTTFLCVHEYCQQQSCSAFTDLSNRAKMISGGRKLLSQILAETNSSPSKTPITNRYSL